MVRKIARSLPITVEGLICHDIKSLVENMVDVLASEGIYLVCDFSFVTGILHSKNIEDRTGTVNIHIAHDYRRERVCIELIYLALDQLDTLFLSHSADMVEMCVDRKNLLPVAVIFTTAHVAVLLQAASHPFEGLSGVGESQKVP